MNMVEPDPSALAIAESQFRIAYDEAAKRVGSLPFSSEVGYLAAYDPEMPRYLGARTLENNQLRSWEVTEINGSLWVDTVRGFDPPLCDEPASLEMLELSIAHLSLFRRVSRSKRKIRK
jgi:hypothetical protein